jgi:hypothetical protein
LEDVFEELPPENSNSCARSNRTENEAGHSKTETRHGKSRAGGRIETQQRQNRRRRGTLRDVRTHREPRRRFRRKNQNTAARRALREKQASHGAPAVRGCRNQKKRRRRGTQREQRREHGNQDSIHSGGGTRLERRLREQQTKLSDGAISSGERSQTAAQLNDEANRKTEAAHYSGEAKP